MLFFVDFVWMRKKNAYAWFALFHALLLSLCLCLSQFKLEYVNMLWVCVCERESVRVSVLCICATGRFTLVFIFFALWKQCSSKESTPFFYIYDSVILPQSLLTFSCWCCFSHNDRSLLFSVFYLFMLFFFVRSTVHSLLIFIDGFRSS